MNSEDLETEDVSELMDFCRASADVPMPVLNREIESLLKAEKANPSEKLKCFLLLKLRYVMAQLIVEAVSLESDPATTYDQRKSEFTRTSRRIRRLQVSEIDLEGEGYTSNLSRTTTKEVHAIDRTLEDLRLRLIKDGNWPEQRLSHSLDPLFGKNHNAFFRQICFAPVAESASHSIYQLDGPLGLGQSFSHPFLAVKDSS